MGFNQFYFMSTEDWQKNSQQLSQFFFAVCFFCHCDRYSFVELTHFFEVTLNHWIFFSSCSTIVTQYSNMLPFLSSEFKMRMCMRAFNEITLFLQMKGSQWRICFSLGTFCVNFFVHDVKLKRNILNGWAKAMVNDGLYYYWWSQS